MRDVSHLVEAVRAAVHAENWYAALALALALPDTCAWLEGSPRGKRRYIDWCRRHVEPTYTAEVGPDRQRQVFMSANDLYALRCAYLHQGVDDITEHEARDALKRFQFIPPPPGGMLHCNQDDATLQLQVDLFCEDICRGVVTWWAYAGGRVGVQERVVQLLSVESI